MDNNTKAIMFILINSLSFSLTPLLGTLIIDSIDKIPYLALGFLISIITFYLYFKVSKFSFNFAMLRSKDIILLALGGGSTYVLSHFTLFISLTYSDNVFLPTILFQTYPIFLVILLSKLKMSNEHLTLKKAFLISLAFFGVVILNVDGEINFDTFSFFSTILPLISSICTAVSVTYITKLSNKIDQQGIFADNSALIATYLSRIYAFLSMIPLIIWYVVFGENINLTINLESSFILLIYGCFVMSLGGLSLYKGYKLAKNQLSIIFLKYLSIPFAVVWLWVFDLGIITSNILIGFMIILSVNILLNLNIEKNYTYNGTVILTLFFGMILFYIDSLKMEDYYDLISITLIFYAIVLSFLIDRTFKRVDEEKEYLLEMVNSINSKDIGLNEKLIQLSEIKNNEDLQIKYHELKSLEEDSKFNFYLDKYIMSKYNKFKISELFVMFSTGVLTLLLLLFFGPKDDFYFISFIKLVLSVAVAFNLLYIFDNDNERNEKILNIKTYENGYYSYINLKKSKSKTEKAISLILLITIFIVYYLVFTLK